MTPHPHPDVRNCPARLLAHGCGECDGCRERDEHATAADVMPPEATTSIVPLPRYYVNDKAELYWEIVDRTTETVADVVAKDGDDTNRDEAEEVASQLNASPRHVRDVMRPEEQEYDEAMDGWRRQ